MTAGGSPRDLDLLRAWRTGDVSAGDRLVRRHFQVVFRFFRNKVDTGVEDLVQQTFAACLEDVDRFREDGTVRAFLLGIARNQLLRHYRERKTARDRFDPEASSVRDLGGSPSAVLAVQEEQRVLLQGLRRIPIDLQIAVELFYWEELSMGEIGQVMGIPPGTVKSRLNRARRLLREAIGAMEEEPDLVETTVQNLDGWARSLRGLVEPEEGG